MTVDGIICDLTKRARYSCVLDLPANDWLDVAAEIERLRADNAKLKAREASARVCDWCDGDGSREPPFPSDVCDGCKGKGIMYDGKA